MWISYRSAHGVTHAEVKATLFIHGVVQTRKLRQRWPVVVERVVAETVVGAARQNVRKCLFVFIYVSTNQMMLCYSVSLEDNINKCLEVC